MPDFCRQRLHGRHLSRQVRQHLDTMRSAPHRREPTVVIMAVLPVAGSCAVNSEIRAEDCRRPLGNIEGTVEKLRASRHQKRWSIARPVPLSSRACTLWRKG